MSVRMLLACLAAGLGLAGAAAAPARAVVGGTLAPAELPGVAFVDAILPSGAPVGCTGTVVTARLVLTAGHCVLDRVTGRRLHAGELLVTTGRRDLDSGGGRGESAVTRIVLDPGFDVTTLHDDAALLVLATPTHARAIRLPAPMVSASATGTATDEDADAPATLAGFGVTRAGERTPPRWLYSAPTVIAPDATCAASWGAQFDAAGELCALDQPAAVTGACNGDSGGPLLDDGVEVGLASYVAEGCVTALPTVFQRTDVLAGWIATVRRQLRPRAQARLERRG